LRSRTILLCILGCIIRYRRIDADLSVVLIDFVLCGFVVNLLALTLVFRPLCEKYQIARRD